MQTRQAQNAKNYRDTLNIKLQKYIGYKNQKIKTTKDVHVY